jgi:hypothetical protein
MLGLRDNWTLATTKLRVRRVRLVVTLIVAGVLFTVLVFGSLVVRGSVRSFQNFVNTGLLNRFVVNIYDYFDYEIGQNPAFIARVEELDKARIAAQAAEAKRLGLPFDPATAQRGVDETPMPDGTKQKNANFGAPTTRQAFLETHPDRALAELMSRAQAYSPKP